MKRVCTWVFVLVLAFGCAAEGFLPDGVLSWKSSVDDVAAQLGESADIQRESMGDYGEYALVAGENAACFGLDCGRLMYTFYDGELFGVYGYFTSDSLDGSAQTLVDRMAEVYGEPEYADSEDMSLSDLIGASTGAGSGLLCRWQNSEDITIEVYRLSTREDYPYLCGFSALNGAVSDHFDDALAGYLDTED